MSWSVWTAGTTRADGARSAFSVDLLAAGVLAGGAVGECPEALGGAGGKTVEVAPEDDAAGGAGGEERGELGALRVIRGRLNRVVGGQVRSAHLEAESGDDA